MKIYNDGNDVVVSVNGLEVFRGNYEEVQDFIKELSTEIILINEMFNLSQELN